MYNVMHVHEIILMRLLTLVNPLVSVYVAFAGWFKFNVRF